MSAQGDYTIIKEIGSGAYGKVFIGENAQTKEKVAIKRLERKTIDRDDYLRNAFFKEIDVMRKCQCAHSVRLIEYIQSQNHYNIIMELCDSDLDIVLRGRQSGFTVPEVRRILKQLNVVFKVMHRENIMHRDLKLKNILVKFTSEDKTKFDVKLSDFGFSKVLDQEVTKTKLGTPMTMAPEVLSGKPYTFKADLWSIGTITYQLLYKNPPFRERNEKLILNRIYTEKVPKNLPCDKEMRSLLTKLLCIDPEKRISWDDYFNDAFFQIGDEDEEEKKEEAQNVKNSDLNKKPEEGGLKKVKCFDICDKEIIEPSKLSCRIVQNKSKLNLFIKTVNKAYLESIGERYETEVEKIKDLNEVCKSMIVFEKSSVETVEIKGVKTQIGKYYFSLPDKSLDWNNLVILDKYIRNKDITEATLQKINKQILDDIIIPAYKRRFVFDFLSTFNFIIDISTEKVFLFDCGFIKNFLGKSVIDMYFIKEASSFDPSIKSNVMNYGATLFFAFFKKALPSCMANDLNSKAGLSVKLPKNKKMSKVCKNFISKCILRNESKRYSWDDCVRDKFYTENLSQKSEEPEEKKTLFTEERIKFILDELLFKYNFIIDFFKKQITSESVSSEYNTDIEDFLMISLFEVKILLVVLSSQEGSTKMPEEEITMIKVLLEDKKIETINIVLSEVTNKFSIFDSSSAGKQLNWEYIEKFKEVVNEIDSLVHEYHSLTQTKFSDMGYHEYLDYFIRNFHNNRIDKLFLNLVEKGNKNFDNQQTAVAHEELLMAKYLCEYIITIRLCCQGIEKTKEENLIQKMDAFFEEEENQTESKIEITQVFSGLKGNPEEIKNISVTFLNGMFKSYFNSRGIRNESEGDLVTKSFSVNLKSNLQKYISFYPAMLKLVNDSRTNL